MQEWFENNIPPIILAIMGGIADYLMSDEHSIGNMFIGMFLAGFTGYLLLLLCFEYHVSQSLTGVICGIGGMSSKSVLKLFKRIFHDRITSYLKMGKNGTNDDK